MSVNIKLFYSLIKISLHQHNDIEFAPSADQWHHLYYLGKKQTLLGVLYSGLKCLGPSQLPPKDLLFKWYAETQQISLENAKLNQKAISVQKIFREYGFQNVVLKGQGIATLYDCPLCRKSGDIDLLLAGGRKKILSFVLPLCPNEHVLYHHIGYSLVKDVDVEVHFTPSWMFCYFTNRKLQKFFKNSTGSLFNHYVELPEQAGRLSIPPLAFNRVFILVHIYRHLFGEGIGLRQVMDYYYVLRQGFTEEERIETLSVLKNLKMLNFTKGIMFILKNVFGLEEQYLLTEPDAKHGKFLLSEIMRAGNFGHFDKTLTTTANDSALTLFIKRSKRNLRFISYYPSEVIWCPLFKIWHFCWRKYHGWI